MRERRQPRGQKHGSCPCLNTGDFQMHLSNLDPSPNSSLPPPLPLPLGDSEGPQTQPGHNSTPGLSPNHPCLLVLQVLPQTPSPPNPLFSLAPTSECSPSLCTPSLKCNQNLPASPLFYCPCPGPCHQHHLSGDLTPYSLFFTHSQRDLLRT